MLARGKSIWLFSTVCAIAAGVPAEAQDPPRYSVTVLSIGARQTKVFDINNSGVIVGEAVLGDGSVRGFIYQNGAATWVPTLGGNASSARAINDAGVVAGAATTADGKYHAFIFCDGVMTDLGTLGADQSFANGINEAGEVSGDLAQLGTAAYRPFIYTGGQMQILPALSESYGRANGINGQGIVVGQSVDSQGASRAYSSSAAGPASNLGTLSGQSEGIAVNDAGETAGFAHTSSGARHAVIHRGGSMIDLGTLGGATSTATSINKWGQAAGSSLNANGQNRAFVYTGGIMHDLNKWASTGSLPYLGGGVALNDRGDVTGSMIVPGANLMQSWVATPNYLLTASPENVDIGDMMTVTWNVPTGQRATDWIGLYRAGAPASEYLWMTYTNGAASGSAVVSAPSPAGAYEFRYFTRNSYNETGVSNPVTTRIPVGYSLSTSGATVNGGARVNVTWTAPAGRPANDWIGLFRVGDSNRDYHAFVFTNGAESGSADFIAPEGGGEFEFRYLLRDGYNHVVKSGSFFVNVAGYSVTPSATTAAAGGSIDVSWVAPEGSSSMDWVALYREGERENRNYLWSNWFYTGGAASGTRSMTMPTTPGRYVLRYLVDNGYVHKAESVVITVE